MCRQVSQRVVFFPWNILLSLALATRKCVEQRDKGRPPLSCIHCCIFHRFVAPPTPSFPWQQMILWYFSLPKPSKIFVSTPCTNGDKQTPWKLVLIWSKTLSLFQYFASVLWAEHWATVLRGLATFVLQMFAFLKSTSKLYFALIVIRLSQGYVAIGHISIFSVSYIVCCYVLVSSVLCQSHLNICEHTQPLSPQRLKKTRSAKVKIETEDEAVEKLVSCEKSAFDISSSCPLCSYNHFQLVKRCPSYDFCLFLVCLTHQNRDRESESIADDNQNVSMGLHHLHLDITSFPFEAINA